VRMVGEHGELGIGMVGYAFMGRAHSQAWRSAGRFFDLPFTPRMAAICGRDRAIGYEHTFTHEVRDLLHAIADGRDPVPSFADGLQVQEVLDAVQRSAAAGAGWTKVGQ